MRFPRVRFSVRKIMVAVAILAVILGLLIGRRGRFRRLALAHKMESFALQVSDLEFYLLLTAASGEKPEAEEQRNRTTRPVYQFREYHEAMADKYDRASDQPWLLVAPDPPPPPRPSRETIKEMLAPLKDEMADFPAGAITPKDPRLGATRPDSRGPSHALYRRAAIAH